MDAVAASVLIRDLGQQAYLPVWESMRRFTDSRGPETGDELWCVQHPPVFTQGQAGKAEHVLNPGDIPVIPVDRGGQVTYHGPGQIVIYPLIDLRRRHLGARDLVSRIENAIVASLHDIGIRAWPRAEAPGVYTDSPRAGPGSKMASIGLRIRKGCSFHGLSLNVAMDLSPFLRINPCGYSGLAMAQVSDFLPDPDIAALQRSLCDHLCRELGYTSAQQASPPALP
jgi:lipoyl(octanoyl) transferase